MHSSILVLIGGCMVYMNESEVREGNEGKIEEKVMKRQFFIWLSYMVFLCTTSSKSVLSLILVPYGSILLTITARSFYVLSPFFGIPIVVRMFVRFFLPVIWGTFIIFRSLI